MSFISDLLLVWIPLRSRFRTVFLTLKNDHKRYLLFTFVSR